jgi:hypothetical protein
VKLFSVYQIFYLLSVLLVILRGIGAITKLFLSSSVPPFPLLLQKSLPFLFLLVRDYIAHGSCGTQEIRMIGVYVCPLYSNQRFNVVRCRAKSFPEEVRDNLN